MRQFGIHYRVVGGFSFYQRAEIKGRTRVRAPRAQSRRRCRASSRAEYAAARNRREIDSMEFANSQKQRDVSLWDAMAAMIDESPGGLAPLRGFRTLIEQLARRRRNAAACGFLDKCSIAPAISICSNNATPPKMPRARKT